MYYVFDNLISIQMFIFPHILFNHLDKKFPYNIIYIYNTPLPSSPPPPPPLPKQDKKNDFAVYLLIF